MSADADAQAELAFSQGSETSTVHALSASTCRVMRIPPVSASSSVTSCPLSSTTAIRSGTTGRGFRVSETTMASIPSRETVSRSSTCPSPADSDAGTDSVTSQTPVPDVGSASSHAGAESDQGPLDWTRITQVAPSHPKVRERSGTAAWSVTSRYGTSAGFWQDPQRNSMQPSAAAARERIARRCPVRASPGRPS